MSESVYKKSPAARGPCRSCLQRARALAVKPFFQACWFTASTECYPFGMAIKRPVNSEAQYKLPMTAKIHPRVRNLALVPTLIRNKHRTAVQ
eukprot:scaffold297826_cov15-Tisochrysis_lutea.AAC.1